MAELYEDREVCKWQDMFIVQKTVGYLKMLGGQIYRNWPKDSKNYLFRSWHYLWMLANGRDYLSKLNLGLLPMNLKKTVFV